MSLKLAFAKDRGKGFFAKLISWKTGSEVEHVELLFSDGICFSTHPKDGATRFKDITFDENWILEDVLMVPPDKERQLRQWCADRVGIPYGWETIMAIGANWRGAENLPNTVICTEVCKAGLQSIDILLNTEVPGMTSPGVLLNEIRAWNAALMKGRYIQR